jgi:asparagine synthase (glutamine-hydrolysing)
MCGIAGAVWSQASQAVSGEQLARLTEALAHRGPDDFGTWSHELVEQAGFDPRPGVALGARRLAVIDPAGGHQPIANEDESIWLVCNGEIYNQTTLRRRLEGTGHRFRTDCDVEVLLHLYEDEGLGFLQGVVGMFALALWDGPRRQLILARDRLGQKPLVYHHRGGRLAFASELKSLMTLEDIPREICPRSLDEYLTYGYIPAPRTIYRNVAKLQPGCLAVYQDDNLSIRRYWAPDWNAELDITLDEAKTELRRLLTESVSLRLASDVPLGVFLSGGIDSAVIAALAQEASSTPIPTFTLGFDEPSFDESAAAREVATHLGTDHHEFRLGPEAMRGLFSDVSDIFDEPFADSSAIPTLALCREARQFVTVALTGDGGDELFAGYPHHRAAGIGASFDRWPHVLQWMATRPMAAMVPQGARRAGFSRRLKRLLGGLRHRGPRRHLSWIAVASDTDRATLLSDAMIRQLGDSDPVGQLRWAYERTQQRDAMTQSSLADLLTYLPGDLMPKIDMCSMSVGLECRSPMLDHRVVEFAAGLPIAWKFRGKRGKWLLKETFGELLPKGVFDRPKRGFALPLEKWLTSSDLRDLGSLGTTGWLQPEALASIRRGASGIADRKTQQWALLMLARWAERFGTSSVNKPAVR